MYTHYLKAIISFLFLFFSSSYIMAEKNPFFFTQIGNENGLTENTITDLLQDSEGYIWIGTNNGLFKYNGYSCKVYRNRPDNTNTLGDNTISCIEEDSRQNIWIITEHHVHKIDRQSKRIHKYGMENVKFMHHCKQRRNGELWFVGEKELFIYDPKLDSLVRQPSLSPLPFDSNVCDMEEDQAGNLYIASKNSGVIVIDSNRQLRYHYKHTLHDKNSLPGGELSDLYIDSHNRIWIASLKDGFSLLNPDKHSFIRFDQSNSRLKSNVVRCLIEIQPNKILIGSFSGLSQIDCNTFEIQTFDFDPQKIGSLGHYSIHNFLKDNTGGLWVGTWNGLNYHNPLRKQISTLTPKTFTGVLGKGQEDKEGNIWFVTEGAGLLCYNPATQEQNTYLLNPAPDAYNKNILKALYIKGDSILCTTNQGCLYLFSRTRKKYELLYEFGGGDIYTIFVDCKNRFWIPTNSKQGLILIDNGKQTNSFPINGKKQRIHYITVIKELAPNKYLFGTLTQELYLYDMHKEAITHLALNQLSGKSKRSGRITGIETDPDGYIYVSTFGNGLFTFDSQLTLLKHYINNDGLTTPYIYTFVKDKHNTLWTLTENGLYYKEYQQKTFTYVPNKQFIKHNYTFQGGSLDNNGILYFPGNKDILCFNPSRLGENNHLPPIHLTDITINNKPINFHDSIPLILKSEETNLAIAYTALDYVEPEQIQYKYKMDGVDEDFAVVGNRRIAYYSNPAPGFYTFHVQASNSDGKWNPKETCVSIQVLPPFYKTNIAYLLYIVGIGIVIYGIIHYFNVRNKLENDIRYKQMEQEKIKEMNEERMRLFTNFSHELRTPLTLISNPLEDLIQNNAFSSEVKRVLDLMKKNTKKMLLLVNNLMDIQKYDAHKMTLQKEHFNLSLFIKESYDMFESIAKKRNIRFTLTNKIPESYEVYYDKQEMEKVIFNLLSNAFKFTPESGNVQLRLSSVSRKNSASFVDETQKSMLVEDYYLHIEVTDNGTGIAPKELENIFQPFHRSSQDLHHQIAGSGIGLSLVRFIIEQHQGLIWVKSTQGTGTQIHVLLPLLEKPIIRKPAIERTDITTKPSFFINHLHTISEKQQTILFAEDNEDVLCYLEQQFKDHYNVLKASNGEEALLLLDIHKADIIVSDVMMPRMDGLELCKRIKSTSKWNHLPVILLTAKTLPKQITEGYKAGADEYIIKPYNIVQLRSRIDNLLENRKQIQKKFEKKLELETFGIHTGDTDKIFLTQYTNIIKENFSNPDFGIDDICKSIGISRAQFYRKAKAQTGLSPAEMIKKLRLEAAAQMLRDTELNIVEIQTKVGFSNSGYFASCFRQTYGVSPKEYRNANKM